MVRSARIDEDLGMFEKVGMFKALGFVEAVRIVSMMRWFEGLGSMKQRGL